MVDGIVLHGGEQFRHAGGFLEEIHVVQVRIAVGVFPGTGRTGKCQQAGKTQTKQGHK